MRKEERQRAYRINCRPAYSAGWQGINFELKCNVMGRVGTARNRVRVRGNQEAVRGKIGTQGRAFPSMTQNRVMCAQGSGRGWNRCVRGTLHQNLTSARFHGSLPEAPNHPFVSTA